MSLADTPSVSPQARSPLDCSTLPNALFWCVAGMVLAIACMYTQSHGDWATLLHVGTSNPRLHQIEAEIGPVSPRDFLGHDGQLTYVIAREPFPAPAGVIVSPYDNNGPIYRYRRILLPLLAGGFGYFDGRTTLTLIVALVALGVGLSAVGCCDLAYQWNAPGWAAIMAMANAGVIIGTLILTVDALAVGLALCGLALFQRGHVPLAALLFAASTLTKEPYALVPLALAAWCWRRHQRWRAAAIALSIVPAGLWSVYLLAAFPGPKSAGASNIGPPLGGLLDALPIWIATEREPAEWLLLAFVTVMLGLVSATMLKHRAGLLRYLLAPWLVVLVCSTLWVWSKPNNPARAFAIMWPLAVIGVTGRDVRQPLVRSSPHG